MNFSINGTKINTSEEYKSPNLICAGATDEDLEWFEKFSYWIEGIFQLGLGSIGFLANLLVLPVLLTQKMKNTFNHLLIFLTMFDNIYVMCSILECIRNYFISTPEQIKLFIYVLYQLQNISFVCSVYQTVLLAFQRYLAITQPLEYYANQSAAAAGGPDWRITLKYTLPNIVFSVIFNLPKFFEFDVQEIVETNSETNMTYAKINLNPTNLRLDDNYVYYYVNWSRFLVSGLIPLVSLTVLNFAIYRAIKERKRFIALILHNRRQNQTTLAKCSTVEDLVLFVIVITFFLCTLPRVVLNMYEMISLKQIRENLHNDCFRLPLWVLIITRAAYFLNCMNCSFNFVIYCVMYSAFRKELKSQVHQIWYKMKYFNSTICTKICISTSSQNSSSSFEMEMHKKNDIQQKNTV